MAAVFYSLAPAVTYAQVVEPASQQLILLAYEDTPVELVLEDYSEWAKRTLIKNPAIKGSITLKSHGKLTTREAMQAIESVFAMQNIALVPLGEKFLKIVQPQAVRQEGLAINMDIPEEGFDDSDELMSQLVKLKYVEVTEVQAVVQSMLHGYGKIQLFERSNSMLITATSVNLKRVLEILQLLDQPVELRMETRIYEIQYSEAAKIASKLKELAEQSGQNTEKNEDQPLAKPAENQPAAVRGVVRARKPAQQSPQEAAVFSAMELAERGIIRGEVKIVHDERTNIIFVLSRPENFIFFDKIVSVLDRPVDPAIVVKVVNLEYAEAQTVAGILNDFIGAAKADSNVPSAAPDGDDPGNARARALQEVVQRRAQERQAEPRDEEKTAIGRLSENTKILADERTNSLLLMGQKGDIKVLEEVIDSLDVMLAQVLIEVLILEVQLGKDYNQGIDWLQKSMSVYSESTARGVNLRERTFSFAGGQNTGSGLTPQETTDLTDSADLSAALGSGLSYYMSFFDLNLDAVIRLAATSRDAKIVSTPVILTTDNTEATINVSEQRPIVSTTSTTSAGELRSNYEYRDIGLQLKVTPRINPEGFVVLEINQAADQLGGEVSIDDNSVPVILKRELNAQIGVQSESTIVLGGLVGMDYSKSVSKVPILGDIPILGRLFRSESKDKNRTELLVLITPYVLTTPADVERETIRLYGSSSIRNSELPEGWSKSHFTLDQQKQSLEKTGSDEEPKVSVWQREIPEMEAEKVELVPVELEQEKKTEPPENAEQSRLNPEDPNAVVAR